MKLHDHCDQPSREQIAPSSLEEAATPCPGCGARNLALCTAAAAVVRGWLCVKEGVDYRVTARVNGPRDREGGAEGLHLAQSDRRVSTDS